MAITIDGTNGLTTDNAALKLDGTTLVVDDTNNRVGIGTSSPSQVLEVGSTGSSNNYIQVTAANNTASGIKFRSDSSATSGWDIGYEGNGNYLFFKNDVLGTVTERARIDSAGRVTMPYQPAFHAYGTTSAASGQTIVFGNTRFNIGSHYSTSTGIFTAPVTGTYLFGWTNIGSNANDVFRYYFRVNGNNIGDLHLRQDTTATGSEYATNAMYTIPWRLNASDYVNIHFQSDGSSSMYSGAANDYPRFWGYLLG